MGDLRQRKSLVAKTGTCPELTTRLKQAPAWKLALALVALLGSVDHAAGAAGLKQQRIEDFTAWVLFFHFLLSVSLATQAP